MSSNILLVCDDNMQAAVSVPSFDDLHLPDLSESALLDLLSEVYFAPVTGPSTVPSSTSSTTDQLYSDVRYSIRTRTWRAH